MKLTFEVEVEHVSGVFRSKDEVAEVLENELSNIEVDVDGTEYNVVDVTFIEHLESKKSGAER